MWANTTVTSPCHGADGYGVRVGRALAITFAMPGPVATNKVCPAGAVAGAPVSSFVSMVMFRVHARLRALDLAVGKVAGS
jgi:hypothetical protein